MSFRFARICLSILLLTGAGAAQAQDVVPSSGMQRIEISGAEIKTLVLTKARLASLPAVEVEVRYMTSKGERGGRFRGPLIWSVLADAGFPEADTQAVLKRTFAVIGHDGYEVVFSMGEIAPELGDTQVLIALSVDGRDPPDSEGLRLIVPGDSKGTRYVRDIARIEIR